MDTFCEQLVKIKKGPKFFIGTAGAWLAVVLIMFICMAVKPLNMLAPIITIAAGYGAYYISGFLSIEYEYIITNGTIDIDIIYAKRSRKRLASFELSDVESIEKLGGKQIDKNRYKSVTVACDIKREDAYVLIASNDSSVCVAVITPNERAKEEIVKFVPKHIGNKAFE